MRMMDLDKIFTKLSTFSSLYEEAELAEVGYTIINEEEEECTAQTGIMLRKMIEIILLFLIKSSVLPKPDNLHDLRITDSECIERNLLNDNLVISEVFLAVLNQTGWILCPELCSDDCTYFHDLPEVFEREVLEEFARELISYTETDEDRLNDFYYYFNVLTFKNPRVQQVESMIEQDLLKEDEIHIFRTLFTKCMRFVEPMAHCTTWNHDDTRYYIATTYKVLTEYGESLQMDSKRYLNIFNLLSYYEMDEFLNAILKKNNM